MLRHLLISVARTSSRSLFAKPNALVYESSLRTLSGQKFAYHTSPISEKQSFLGQESSQKPEDAQFSKKNSGTGEKETAESLRRKAHLYWLLAFGALGFYLYDQPLRAQQPARISNRALCHLDCHPKLEKAILDDVNAKLKKANEYDDDDCVWKAPIVEPFEGVKVSYVLTRPVIRNWFGKEGTDVMYNVAVTVHTPWFSRRPTVKQMSDSLKLRGIHVECSVDGIRRGLSEYALKYTQEMVRTHLEKKCGNCDLSTGPIDEPVEPTSRCPIQKIDDAKKEELEKNAKICRKKFHPKLPTSGFQDAAKKATPFDNAAVSFEITRPSFLKWLIEDGTVTSLAVEVKVNLPNFTATAGIKEICEGLKRHGINVDGSESGLRRGLAEYVLKHMSDGINKHLEKKCDCGYFSAPFVIPPK